MAAPISSVKKTGEISKCGFWAQGECRLGEECEREHHPMLSPALVRSRQHPEYMLPNELGVACERCMQSGRLCDKLGRDAGPEDPCSECRHFGGDTADCVLNMNVSYNDAAWHQMVAREAFNYTLSEAKPRDKLRKGKIPHPMPATRVKRDWLGKSREELLQSPDSIVPDFARSCPRAYLVPPRPTTQEKRSEEWAKRGREEANPYQARSSTQLPPLPSAKTMQPDPWTMPRMPEVPPPHPNWGPVRDMTFDCTTGEWTLRYDQFKLSGPASDVQPGQQQGGQSSSSTPAAPTMFPFGGSIPGQPSSKRPRYS